MSRFDNLNPWLITDMHLQHKNMVPYCGRPEDFTEQIIKNLQEKVKDDDILIDLGDVIFGDSSKLAGYLSTIPGTKILVVGNHDQKKVKWYMEQGYTFACDMFTWGRFVFTHRPLTSLPSGCDYNIHGHKHDTPWNDPRDPIVKKPWHLKLALEEVGYGPIRLNDFLALNKLPSI